MLTLAGAGAGSGVDGDSTGAESAAANGSGLPNMLLKGVAVLREGTRSKTGAVPREADFSELECCEGLVFWAAHLLSSKPAISSQLGEELSDVERRVNGMRCT